MDGYKSVVEFKVWKYFFASSITLGDNINAENIVGIAINAYIPSIRLITKDIETVAPIIVEAI